jgi:hypothetical protein
VRIFSTKLYMIVDAEVKRRKDFFLEVLISGGQCGD